MNQHIGNLDQSNSSLLLSDKATIVILNNVEPEPALLALNKTLTSDYSVQSFSDKNSLLDYVNTDQSIHLFIFDINGLGDDGDALIKHLREIPLIKYTPIFITASLNDTAQEQKALALDASDYISIPFSLPILVARIKSHILADWSLRITREQNQFFNMKMTERSEKLHSVHSELIAKNKELTSREKETLLVLCRATDYRDPETGAHLLRMSNYAKLIAKNLGFSETEQELILKAAPLHDIGKVGIPDEILLKPGRLTPDEFEIMKQHVLISYDILQTSTSPLMRLAAELAISHHEKFDGSGYPSGLKGDSIPLSGRIIAVADVFDALTSSRPYKPAWAFEKAVDFLREQRGNHFDPLCVDAFLQNLEEVINIRQRYLEDD